jgi:hypothetical protein
MLTKLPGVHQQAINRHSQGSVLKEVVKERYPPNRYRLVKRLTGKTWRQACADGLAIMLLSFVNRCLTLRDAREVAVRTVFAQIA